MNPFCHTFWKLRRRSYSPYWYKLGPGNHCHTDPTNRTDSPFVLITAMPGMIRTTGAALAALLANLCRASPTVIESRTEPGVTLSFQQVPVS